jgi:hypothetical protein
MIVECGAVSKETKGVTIFILFESGIFPLLRFPF